MDRLTERNKHGVAEMRFDLPAGLDRNPVARLADYEDTGLMPAEVVALKAERDAAVKDIEEMLRLPRDHTDCIHFCRYDPAGDCPFSFGKDCEPKWRGPEKDCLFYRRYPNEREKTT